MHNYILYIKWTTGETEKHDYTTREDAEEAARGYRMVFGSQIEYTGIDRNAGGRNDDY